MLFDIRGRRKRFIQVIYVFLALLLGGSLVFFGIGGDAPGGLGDALGISNNSSGGGGSDQFNEDIEQAEAALEVNPENAEALAALARFQYLSGQQQLEIDDETGGQVLTDEAIASFDASVDAWERYLKAVKGKPDPTVATLVFQAYGNLAFARNDPVLIERTLQGAVKTAEVIADDRPSPNSYLQLASAAYLAGDKTLGDEAAANALKEVDDASRDQLKTQLDSAKQQGRLVQQQLKAAEPDQQDFENPLGGLGSGGASGDPNATP
jgi:tetratricopeptide (TPR) repeat protein